MKHFKSSEFKALTLQIFFGTRLPIIQSGSYVYFAVAAGIMSKNPCEKEYTVVEGNSEYDRM